MAVLSDGDRVEVMREFMAWWSHDNEPATMNKEQLREVVNAADAWADANAASYNTAIPQPQRGLMTARQKAKMLSLIITKRFGG